MPSFTRPLATDFEDNNIERRADKLSRSDSRKSTATVTPQHRQDSGEQIMAARVSFGSGEAVASSPYILRSDLDNLTQVAAAAVVGSGTRLTAACAGCRKLRQKCSMVMPCERCVRSNRDCVPNVSHAKPKKHRISNAEGEGNASRRQRIHERESNAQELDDIPFTMTTRSAASTQDLNALSPNAIAEDSYSGYAGKTKHRASMPGNLYNTFDDRNSSIRSQSISEFPDSGTPLRRTMPNGLSATSQGKRPAISLQSPAPVGTMEARISLAPAAPYMRETFDVSCRPTPDVIDVSTKALLPSQVLPQEFATASNQQVWRLEDVEIELKDASDLFNHFYHLYAPQLPLPILDARHAPSQCFDRNKLLFWAIIGVASRTWNRDPFLLIKLSKPLRDLALKSTYERTLDTVQAILLLLNWPVRETLAYESRVPLAAAMIMMARRAGIHRPAHGQDFVRAKGPPTHGVVVSRTILWVYCLILYRNTCISKGHDPALFFDGRANNLDGYKPFLPSGLAFRLEVSDCLAECLSSIQQFGIEEMTADMEHGFKHLLGVFATRMAALRIKAQELSREESIFYEVHELVVLTIYFFIDIDAKNWYYFNRLAQSACEVTGELDAIIQADPRNVAKLPIESTWAFLLSGTVLIRLMRSSVASTFDTDRLERCFYSARDDLDLLSRRDNKAAAKVTLLLSQLANSKKAFRAPDGTVDTRLRVRTRLAASCVFDAAKWWRDEFGPADMGEQVPVLEGAGVSGETNTQGYNNGELVNGMGDMNWMFLDFDGLDWGLAGA